MESLGSRLRLSRVRTVNLWLTRGIHVTLSSLKALICIHIHILFYFFVPGMDPRASYTLGKDSSNMRLHLQSSLYL